METKKSLKRKREAIPTAISSIGIVSNASIWHIIKCVEDPIEGLQVQLSHVFTLPLHDSCGHPSFLTDTIASPISSVPPLQSTSIPILATSVSNSCLTTTTSGSYNKEEIGALLLEKLKLLITSLVGVIDDCAQQNTNAYKKLKAEHS